MASVPGFYSSENLGFRCAHALAAGEDGGLRISRQLSKAKLVPIDDAGFAKIAAYFEYKRAPLNARVVKRTEAEAWILEEIAFDSNDGPVTAYLFLPKNRKPPYQVIHFVPAGDVEGGYRTLLASIELRLTPLVRSGRAVFSVLLSGYIGRPNPRAGGNLTREDRVDAVVDRIADLRRGIDYLVSRPDIDKERIGFWGPSAGGSLGMLAGALEHRYRSFAVNGVGYQRPSSDPRIEIVNFVPRITMPKLIQNGRWDETVPLETSAQPMFDLMREPKRLTIYDGGHVPTPEVLIPTLNGWFDETMGPVR